MSDQETNSSPTKKLKTDSYSDDDTDDYEEIEKSELATIVHKFCSDIRPIADQLSCDFSNYVCEKLWPKTNSLHHDARSLKLHLAGPEGYGVFGNRKTELEGSEKFHPMWDLFIECNHIPEVFLTTLRIRSKYLVDIETWAKEAIEKKKSGTCDSD